MIERLERQLKAARSKSRRHEGSGDAITADAVDHLILAFRKSGWIVDFDPHQLTAQAPDGKVINFALRDDGKVGGMVMLSAESMGGLTETLDGLSAGDEAPGQPEFEDIDPDSLDGDGGLSEARGL